MSIKYDKKLLEKIAAKVISGKATEEERFFLDQYYDSFNIDTDISQHLSEEEKKQVGQEIKARLFKAISQESLNIQPLYKRLLIRVAAAAAIVIMATIGIYYYNTDTAQKLLTNNKRNDIAPAGNKAVLTLANGTRIVLNSVGNGTIATQGNASVVKLASGLIAYQATNLATESTVYNTVTTSRGGKYNLTLADGTKVWLNAASSINYPASFTGNERNVSVTGEAYFEVAKDKDRPFHVTTGSQTIEVLGTHFNVNAYTDEAAITTTLLEGKVKVLSEGQSLLLNPGQEAINPLQGANLILKEADTEQAVAWKNGLFSFKHADLKTIMRQISRWYNVKVTFKDEVNGVNFTGKIYRNSNASQVLQVLSNTNIHFYIERPLNDSTRNIIITR